MRFVFAIVAFAVAAALAGVGIAQRTILLEPDRVTIEATIDSPESYLVVDPALFDANVGAQIVTVGGSDEVYLAYGRTSDVVAWIGDDAYTKVGYDSEAGEITMEDIPAVTDPSELDPLTGEPVDPATETEALTADELAAIASPAGSDLWLDEFTAQGSLTTTLDLPNDISILVASDGTAPAPADLSVSWPLDNSTPWAGPLLLGGGLFFLLGLYLLATGFIQHRRGRGPRRNMPGGIRRGKLPSAPKPKKAALTGGTKRAIGRSSRIALVPVALFATVALTACSPNLWPRFDGGTPTPSATATDGPLADVPETDDDVRPPAVTTPQIERIMDRIAELTTTADAALDGAALEERFAGDALATRVANYSIRATLPDYAAPIPIPAEPWNLTLPEQTDSWPRVVLTVSESDDPTIAPTAVVLEQASPRENYVVTYIMSLAASAQFPRVAPTSVGATSLADDSKFLILAPDQIAAAYGDILMTGAESPSYDLFDTTDDELMAQLGPEGQASIAAAQPPTASIAFAMVEGTGRPISLATNESGAVITVDLVMTENVTPNDGGTVGFGEGVPAAALSGFTAKSSKGVTRSSTIQMLFSVPAIGSDDKIVLLGWSEAITSASEIP
ncbi:hypothetical protein MN032_10655 [Agromyces atrinae]|uniref:hypothetical protein n=1 Tax=Agromyces atrinae TaxID=592376 RepID=UPI001F5601D6|nr:hypothetical protein [Agromyces atrinae]MCI2958156.1 hypothetical protein [Agromyces atrinae]